MSLRTTRFHRALPTGRRWRRPAAGTGPARTVLRACGLLLMGAFLVTPAGASGQTAVEGPKVVLGSVPFTLTVHGADDLSSMVEVRSADGTLIASGTVGARQIREFRNVVVHSQTELPLEVRVGGTVHTVTSPYAPAWFSILPPLVAIVLALVFKEVITALLAGIWLGALAVAGYNPVQATWRVIDQYVVPALGDTDGGHTQIVVFSLLLGGMVGMISKNGGTLGVVRAVAPLARNRRRGKLATAAAGLAIFFDDYANTLVVGNTMRPITDRLKVSREKLAYLVDSTAAPVAALVPVSTWVGYEISLIGSGLTAAAGTTTGAEAAFLGGLSPYTVFIQTIPYLFYPILAMAFVFLTSYMNRDFGPMARAEKRAAAGRGLFREGARPATDTSASFVNAKEGAPERWWNAGLPVFTVVTVVLGGLYVSGRAAVGAADPAGGGLSPDATGIFHHLRDTFGAADPFNPLLWGSLAGCLVAAALSLGQRVLSVHECVDAWLGGVKAGAHNRGRTFNSSLRNPDREERAEDESVAGQQRQPARKMKPHQPGFARRQRFGSENAHPGRQLACPHIDGVRPSAGHFMVQHAQHCQRRIEPIGQMPLPSSYEHIAAGDVLMAHSRQVDRHPIAWSDLGSLAVVALQGPHPDRGAFGSQVQFVVHPDLPAPQRTGDDCSRSPGGEGPINPQPWSSVVDRRRSPVHQIIQSCSQLNEPQSIHHVGFHHRSAGQERVFHSLLHL